MSAPQLIDTAGKFRDAFHVSRETTERLSAYERLLRQWQKGTNLVAPATLDHIWHRHFADSAQLLRHAPDESRIWVDLGSGAGFPGLVIAICAANQDDLEVHLVESNARKCAFLHEVVRETGCPVEIHEQRIESMTPAATVPRVEIVTSRALAPLDRLLELASPFFGEGTVGLFLKGKTAEQEHEDAARHWRYTVGLLPSITEEEARIVRIDALRRRGSDNVEAVHE